MKKKMNRKFDRSITGGAEGAGKAEKQQYQQQQQ